MDRPLEFHDASTLRRAADLVRSVGRFETAALLEEQANVAELEDRRPAISRTDYAGALLNECREARWRAQCALVSAATCAHRESAVRQACNATAAARCARNMARALAELEGFSALAHDAAELAGEAEAIAREARSVSQAGA